MEEALSASEITADAVDAFEAAMAAIVALAAQYTLSVIGAIVILIIGYMAAGFVERSVRSAASRIRGFDETLQRFFSKVARWGVMALVLVMVLSQFGVQTTSIIAAMGAVGLAVGLALQGTLQNVAAGIMLLVLRPFKAGEYIDAGGVAGTVIEIGLFATELKTYKGIFVLAPNSQLWNSPVTNFSRNPTRMEDVVVGISYEDDVSQAQSILLELAQSDGRVLAEPPPSVFVSELADSSVNLTIRYWTVSADWFNTARELTKGAKQALEAAGMTIPFPQRDLHLIYARGGPLPSPASPAEAG